jgi:hypothetical protein
VGSIRQPVAVLIAEENLFTMKMALLVILETGWDVREDEQLNLCCFKMSVGHEMVTKLANPMDQVEKIEMVGGHKTVTELANPSDQVEKSVEFDELCDAVQAKNPSVMYNEMYDEMYAVMYDVVYGVMYAEMYDVMCSSVFDTECRTMQCTTSASQSTSSRSTPTPTPWSSAGTWMSRWASP